MKKIPLSLLLVALAIAPLRADDASVGPWARLAQQADQMAAAVQAQDTHALHGLDHDINLEVADLQANGPALPDADKKKLNILLGDMGVQASAAHHDAHQAQWDDAAAAQAKLAGDLKQAQALLPKNG